MAKFYTSSAAAEEAVKKELERRNTAAQSLSDILSSEVGSVTSRDQIIDPYSLVDPSNYSLNRRGKAQYASDLEAAKLYAERQEAAYQEWYNSPAQVAARERAAGLNPDLIGLDDSGNASDVAMSDVSPMADIPTNAEQLSTVASGVMSIISSVSSIAGAAKSFAMLPQELELMRSQSDLLGLQAITQFEDLAFSDIQRRLADATSAAAAAGDTFDAAAWMSDEANFDSAGFLSAYAPSDDPRYAAAYSRARQNVQSNLGPAYKTHGDTVRESMSTARELASPFYQRGQFINQINYAKPLMALYAGVEEYKAQFEKDVLDIKTRYARGIDVDSAVDAVNAQFEADAEKAGYNADYYAAMNGEIAAKYDQMKQRCEALTISARHAIIENYFNTWKENPASMQGIAAVDIVLDGAISRAPEFLMQWLLSQPDNPDATAKPYPVPSSLETNFGETIREQPTYNPYSSSPYSIIPPM